MERIVKISHYLLKLFNFLLIALPSINLIVFLSLEYTPFRAWIQNNQAIEFTQKTPEGVVNLLEVPFTALTKLIYLSSSLISIIPILLGILLLIRLFKNYSQKIFFSTVNTQCYRQLALLFFLNALLIQPLSNLLSVLSITLSHPINHPYITLSFNSPSLAEILIGLVLLVISWIMHEAQRAQEEQQLVI